jgi:hypothetical protein
MNARAWNTEARYVPQYSYFRGSCTRKAQLLHTSVWQRPPDFGGRMFVAPQTLLDARLASSKTMLTTDAWI